MAFVPDDLRDTSTPDTDKNYFKIVITDLDLSTTYPIQFRWQYEDKTYSDWSAVKNITTAGESSINAPEFLAGDLSSNGSALIIKWSGNDDTGNPYGSNLERIEVYIRGGSYGATSVSASTFFTSAGTKLLTVDSGANYYVKLRAVTKNGGVSSFSTERVIAAVAPLVADTTAPSAPASGTLTAGIDNSTGATIGFNAYIDVSWNAVSDSTLRGYRIRFRVSGSSDPYSYVDSPGTGTTFRLNGLSIGTTYEVAVASYDELNNTSSSYTSLGTAQSTGTPFIGKNITTQGYFGASASGDTGEFRFGYGVDTGKRGLRFDTNNYWYIDSSAAASFRLGGASNNYIQWNGSTFTIDGNITARGGSFSGNVAMTSVGASIYNGTLDGSGALNSDGFILNKDGLQFRKSGAIAISLTTADGKLTATDAVITGNVTATEFSSTGNFSFAGGLLQGTVSSLTLNGGSITIQAIGTVETDNNNFAGDPTLTLNTSGQLVKGRRFIFNGPTEPTSSLVLTGGTASFTPDPAGSPTITVKVGDILMVRE